MVNNWNNNISDSSISMRISIIYEDIDNLSNINDWLVVTQGHRCVVAVNGAASEYRGSAIGKDG